VKKIKTVLY